MVRAFSGLFTILNYFRIRDGFGLAFLGSGRVRARSSLPIDNSDMETILDAHSADMAKPPFKARFLMRGR